MATDTKIRLHIDDQVFNVKRDLLCEYSDYFCAMFSGNYVEKEKQDIIIDVVDANAMEKIILFMHSGLLDLSDYTLATVGNLAMAANFLQVTELIKQIEWYLNHILSVSNCMEIMIIAENASYSKLERLAAAFGLLSFKDMKPKYVPNIHKLFWFLSHPSLNTDNEADVFKFGLNWILHPETCPCADILLVVLGCLDVSKLTTQDLKEMSLLMKDCENSLAAKVVDCLKMILDNKLKICISVLVSHMKALRETFTDIVFKEVYHIVKYSKERKLDYTPVVPIWGCKDGVLEYATHFMFTFSLEKGFKRWLQIADKELWGWTLASWGASRLVQVGGEFGRGTGQFMTDVKIYDTLRKEWIAHGVNLPPRRHAGVTICGDLLFIIGGVGGFRVIQDQAMVYDLQKRTHRRIENFPDAIQSPAVCTHYGSVYASGHKNIYKYEDLGAKDEWVTAVSTDIRTNHMVSFKEYVYCTQNYFSNMYRFRPGIDIKLEMVTQFTAPPAALCNIGNSLMVFTKPVSGQQELKVETYTGPCMCPEGTCSKGREGCGTQLLWHNSNATITVNDVAGACALVMTMPEINIIPSQYHQKYIKRFGKITYDNKTNF